MTDINKLRADLFRAACRISHKKWVAYIHKRTKTYAVHTPDDARCGDVINWPGFDGVKSAAAKAEFIALANPENILALLNELQIETAYSRKYEGESTHFHELAELECERANKAEEALAFKGRQIKEMTMFIKRLSYSLRYVKPESKLAKNAMEYLINNELIDFRDVIR